MTYRIKMLGDHSSYHGGSAAAYNSICTEIINCGNIIVDDDDDDDYDLLVVNGEGSMHHGSGGFKKKINLIARALDSNKRVYLINTVWQDNPPDSLELLKRCEQVVVREVLSQEELERNGVKSRVFIDQSYHEYIDENVPYLDYKGAVVFTDFWSKDFDCFVKLTSKWAQKFHYLDMQSMSWSSIVKSLRTASLLVTGRHHAVYAACKAETPFIAMRGNTHKIEGLIKTANVDIPVFSRFDNLKECVVEGISSDKEYFKLFEWMRNQKPWRIDI